MEMVRILNTTLEPNTKESLPRQLEHNCRNDPFSLALKDTRGAV